MGVYRKMFQCYSWSMSQLRNMNIYVQSALVAIVLTFLSFVSGSLLGWIDPAQINWIEVVAVTASYACTWLTYHQKRWSYIVGVATTAIYVVVFLQAGLVASAILNIYLVPTVIFGFFRWGKDSNAKKVQTFNWKLAPVYVVVVSAFYFGAVWITQALGGTMAPLDAAILIGTILAQFLLDNKVLANWFIWIGVNIISIYVYFNSGLFFAGTQYVLFLIGAVYGYFTWKKAMFKEVSYE